MPSIVLTVTVEPDMPRGEVQARTTLRNLSAIPRLQRICERFGLKPTYLLTWPAASRPEAASLFSTLQAEGRCEIGACLQPWTTPPFSPTENRLEARTPGVVSSSTMEAKLQRLTAAVQSACGTRPLSHRAAGFGITGAVLQALERLDYRIDTSVTPLVDGRPAASDWRTAPLAPYFPDRQAPASRGSCPILEVPVTVGWDRDLPGFASRMALRAPAALRLANSMMPVVRVRWLDPTQCNVADLRHLARLTAERGLPVLNVCVRSHQLAAGESAVSATAKQVDATFEALEGLLRFAVDELRATPHGLVEFADSYFAD